MSPLSSVPAEITSQVRRHRLDNGLVVLVRENRTSPTVSSMVWYGVGSKNEEPGETGRSHFLEHMLFKGTEQYGKGEIDHITMKNGGSNNAFTSHDFTAYYFNFASDRWATALDIESDRMVHTVFDASEFEAERKVVIEELKAGLDQPWGKLMQELNARAFDRHPYRNPVIGWLDDLEAATVEGMEAHYQRYYHPANATLVLVGDVEAEEAIEKAEKAFGGIKPRVFEQSSCQPEPAQEGEKRFDLRWRSDVPRLAIAYHAPAIGHPDSYPLQILTATLSEGKASRLYQRLVEREQVTTFVSAEYGESKDPTLLYIRAEGRDDALLERVEASITDELVKIAEDGVSEHELDRAKHQIEAHFIFSMERSLDQAMLLGHIETLDSLDYLDHYLPRISAVDSSQVADVCGRYLSERNRTVGWLSGEETELVTGDAS